MRVLNFKNVIATVMPLESSGLDSSRRHKQYKAYMNEVANERLNVNADGRLSTGARENIQAMRRDWSDSKSVPTAITMHFLKYKIKDVIYTDTNFHSLEFVRSVHLEVRRRLRKYRQQLKVTSRPIKMGRFVFSKVGSVFDRGGQIYAVYLEKKLADVYKSKAPVDDVRYVGLELEFCAPINEKDFAFKLLTSGLYKFAQLKTDGSLRPKEGESPFELALLLKETNYKKDLKAVCDLLKSINAQAVNRRCGLHVHIDMRKRDKEVVYNNLVACQRVLLSIVDPKRFNNEFCRLVKSRKFPTNFTGERTERYRTINAASYYKYKTLEVRMHEGTVEYADIVSWMDLLIRIASHREKFKSNIGSLLTLYKQLKLKKSRYDELIDKRCYWQINGNSAVERTFGLEDPIDPSPLVDLGELTLAAPQQPTRRTTIQVRS